MSLLIFRFKGLITLLNINSFDRASRATFAASAAMAIVWCIAQTENIIPISGTRSAKQLEECWSELALILQRALRLRSTACYRRLGAQGSILYGPMSHKATTDALVGASLGHWRIGIWMEQALHEPCCHCDTDAYEVSQKPARYQE